MGLGQLNMALAIVDRKMRDRDFALGEKFSLCDGYLYVFTRWMQRPALQGQLDECPALVAHAKRVSARPAVKRALAADGITSTSSSTTPISAS